MRVTIADIKKRLTELDGEDELPIVVIVEARCTNDLDLEGELLHSFKVTYFPDGHSESENLFESDNKTIKERDNEG